MAKVSPLQSNFNSGEVSPLFYGRVETDRYKTALAKCLNYIPMVQGGMVRRSGTMFVAEVKTSSKHTRLVAFEFSTTQAYILEFGDQYIRFYKDNGQILSAPLTPYEIASPYLEADLFQLKYTQSADVLYLVHPSYAPRKLTRTGHTAWTLTTIDFQDGPYLNTNATPTTFTPSGTTGAITITASAASFVSTDVDRLVRIKNGAAWGWAKITAFTSATVVNATVMRAFSATTATTNWRLGLWSVTTGYPGAVVFHEDRLTFGGVPFAPQRLDGSNSSDYENFSPTQTDGSVIDSNAISFGLNSNDVNLIRWMTSDEKGLLAGSVGGEWVIRPSSLGEALSPTNIAAKRATSYGSANVQPVQVGKATIFIQRAGRKLREYTYFYDVDGFRATDLTLLSEHITGNRIVQLAYQKEPQSLVWCVRDDGVLATVTYERELDSLQAGWSRHIVGGYSDAANSDARVESVSVIPSPDGSREDVWLIVQRYIDGAVVRYVEYITQFFDEFVEQKDAFFVDCGLTYDNPLTITAVTKANPAVVTSTAHGLSNGDVILISDVLGMDEINGRTFTVVGVAANTFQLTDEDGNVDSTAYTTYVSGGEAREYVTNISGLDHLEGQTVSILGDGAVQPDKVVTSGAITLASRATTVHIGLQYESDGQLLRLEAGASDGTALGKIRRMHQTGILFHRSLGIQLGFAEDHLTQITFRTAGDLMTRAPELFSGVLVEILEADYDYEGQLMWRQDQPLPSAILAIMPRMTTQENG